MHPFSENFVEGTIPNRQCFGSGFNQVGGSGQKWPTKIEKGKKFHVLKCWMFLFEDWRLLCSLDVLYLRRPRDKKIAIFYQKNIKFFLVIKPWIRIQNRIWISTVFSLKCWLVATNLSSSAAKNFSFCSCATFCVKVGFSTRTGRLQNAISQPCLWTNK
jgi:hypothetical protein